MIEVGEYKVKEGLYYTKDHEWAQVLEDGTVLVGVSDYAQKELGDLAYVELPEVGKEVNKGDVLCELESVKAVSEVYAPVSGEVVEVNEELEDSPELINEDLRELDSQAQTGQPRGGAQGAHGCGGLRRVPQEPLNKVSILFFPYSFGVAHGGSQGVER